MLKPTKISSSFFFFGLFVILYSSFQRLSQNGLIIFSVLKYKILASKFFAIQSLNTVPLIFLALIPGLPSIVSHCYPVPLGTTGNRWSLGDAWGWPCPALWAKLNCRDFLLPSGYSWSPIASDTVVLRGQEKNSWGRSGTWGNDSFIIAPSFILAKMLSSLPWSPPFFWEALPALNPSSLTHM